MKYLTSILLIIGILNGHLLQAQSNKCEIGVTAAPALSYILGNDFISQHDKPGLGYTAGLSFQYNISWLFAIHSDLVYERIEERVNIDFTNAQGQPGPTETGYLRFHYLTLPVLARVTFGNRVKFFINAGPFIGFLLRANEITPGDPLSGLPGPFISNQTSFLKPVDAGVTTGLGIMMPVSRLFDFSFEVRNNLGLVNISTRAVYGNGTIQTGITDFLLGFAYKFAVKKERVRKPRIRKPDEDDSDE